MVKGATTITAVIRKAVDFLDVDPRQSIRLTLRKARGSIMKRASERIAYYPLVVSDAVELEDAVSLARLWELRIVELMVLVMRNNPATKIMSDREFKSYLKSYQSDPELVGAVSDSPDAGSLLDMAFLPKGEFEGMNESEVASLYEYACWRGGVLSENGGWAVSEADPITAPDELVQLTRSSKTSTPTAPRKAGGSGRINVHQCPERTSAGSSRSPTNWLPQC